MDDHRDKFKVWAVIRGLAVAVSVLTLVGCTTYAHVKVVDQQGEPVKGVLVRSDIQPGNAFFSSGETTVEHTDEQGRVQLPAGRWFRFTKIEKEGYQFRPNAQLKREYGDYMLGRHAAQFTSNNPLVIRAWKRGEQPELTYVSRKVFFPDDIEECTLTLVEPTWKNNLEKPLIWRVNLESIYRPVKEHATQTRQFKARQWRGQLSMPGARLQDTDDLFMNRAPEQGYEEKIEWGLVDFIDEEEERQVFIRGQGGEFYGGAIFFFEPDHGTKAKLSDVNTQGAYFQFWFNFDGSTNIMRRPGKTWWRAHRMYGDNVRDTRVYCQEAPED